MKNKLVLPAVLMLLACGMLTAPANADPILWDWAANVDGTTSEYWLGDSIPGETSLFDASTGLGTITVTVTGVGSHYVGLFVDHEVDETTNTYFNENGATSGTALAGQTWEIDEPGWVFGDIYWNTLDGTLDGTNAIPAGSEDDVSMALAWNFVITDLGMGGSEWATVVFNLSTEAPLGGFYLQQTDFDTGESVYFSSDLTVVPVPGALLLGSLGLGVAGRLVGRFNRRRTRK